RERFPRTPWPLAHDQAVAGGGCAVRSLAARRAAGRRTRPQEVSTPKCRRRLSPDTRTRRIAYQEAHRVPFDVLTADRRRHPGFRSSAAAKTCSRAAEVPAPCWTPDAQAALIQVEHDSGERDGD